MYLLCGYPIFSLFLEVLCMFFLLKYMVCYLEIGESGLLKQGQVETVTITLSLIMLAFLLIAYQYLHTTISYHTPARQLIIIRIKLVMKNCF